MILLTFLFRVASISVGVWLGPLPLRLKVIVTHVSRKIVFVLIVIIIPPTRLISQFDQFQITYVKSTTSLFWILFVNRIHESNIPEIP